MERDPDDMYWDNVLDQPPLEFFEAAGRGKAAVAEYLESDRPFTLYTRVAMALWLRGELKRPKGRPKLEQMKRVRLLLAAHHYNQERAAMRSNGSRVRGTAKETMQRISDRYKVNFNDLDAQVRRGKQVPGGRAPHRDLGMREVVLSMYEAWRISLKKSEKKSH
jgi:hypothetical protein